MSEVVEACKCVSHVFQTLTDLDEQATMLSVDGVGALDLISRNAMMQGLMHMQGGVQVLPCTSSAAAHQLVSGKTTGEQGNPHAPVARIGHSVGRSFGEVERQNLVGVSVFCCSFCAVAPAETVFGQNQFWPIHFWPVHFWPIHFRVVLCWCLCCVCCVVVGCCCAGLQT